MDEYNTQPISPGERRKKLKKLKRKRMMRLTLVVAAAVLLLCIIAVPVVTFVAFKIDSFKIEGKSRYTQEQIVEASGVSMGTNLITLNVEKVQQSITQKLPFIESAKVTKSMPGTLVITVSESSRVYAIELAQGNYLITSKTFKALETISTPPEGAIIIKCQKPTASEPGKVISFIYEGKSDDETADKMLDLLLALDAAMEKTKIKDIELMNLLDTSNIRLLYQNRFLLRMGSGTSLDSKLDLAIKAIESEDDINGVNQCGTILLTSLHKATVESHDSDDIALAASLADDSEIYKVKEKETEQDGEENSADGENADGGDSTDEGEETTADEENED